MATAKKPVVKRAAPKKPVAVKPAAKPRGRPAKAKVAEEEEPKAHDYQQTNAETASGSENVGQQIEPSTQDILSMVEVIDLRNSSIVDRFAVVAILAQEGYVFNTDIEGDPFDSWMTYLSTEALRIGNNKILYAVTEAEVKDSYDVSTPVVDHVNHRVGFTFPGPDHPDFLEFGSAKYVRVG